MGLGMVLGHFITKMAACMKANGNITKCKVKGSCSINRVRWLIKGSGTMTNFQEKEFYTINILMCFVNQLITTILTTLINFGLNTKVNVL